jgi:pimeloyl-ACP methyl ester carboxylesterase
MAGAQFLLVHGAWHGSWCWDRLVPELAGRGRVAHTVDLPSSGSASGMAEDAEVVRRAIDGIDAPVVVVGHSYGAIPMTEATAGLDAVSHLVYLAAFMLDVGEALNDIVDARGPDTDTIPPFPGSGDLLYADVDRELADSCVARLTPQSRRSFADRLTVAGWHNHHSSYIVCDEDRILAPEVQERMAVRAKTVHHMPTSHSPLLSAPADLAALLDDIAGE